MSERPQPRKQETPQELRDALLEFIRHKFYEGHGVDFVKDRRRLLQWVVLWPARWFNQRGVTETPERYKQIITGILLDAVRFGDTSQINYLPAWLAKVVQSHFNHHGDELYAVAKSARTLADHAVLVLGRIPRQAADPVRDLSTAYRLLKSAPKAKRGATKAAVKQQLNLL
jgi:hypothetical protein